MLDTIKKALKQSGADGWKVLEKQIRGQEAYFIEKNLEMRRQKDILNYSVTVYKDQNTEGELKRGAMTVKIHPTHKKDEVTSIVERAVRGASDINNPWYPLFDPKRKKIAPGKQDFSKSDLSEEIEVLTDMLNQIECPEGILINSHEIFLSKNNCRLINSNGLDTQWEESDGLLELVISAPSEKEESVELIRQFHFSGTAKRLLSVEIEKLIRQTAHRAAAIPMPTDLKCPVVLSGSNVKDFFFYYVAKSSAVMVHEKLSGFKPGSWIQENNGKGDKITLELTPHIPFSHLNQVVDEDGVPLKEEILIENGRLRQYRSDIRYGHYLSSKVTGNIKNYRVKKGSLKEETLRQTPHLDIHHFSDFHVDTQSGSFGGEIRLAYYHDGTRIIPVTGGAISGSIESVQNEMTFASEVTTCENFQGPRFIYFPKINITGCH